MQKKIVSIILLTLFVTFSFSQEFTNHSKLPIISIYQSEGANITDGAVYFCEMKIFFHADGSENFLTDAPYFSGFVNARLRGNYSASLPQKPLALETQTATQQELDTSLFGFPSESDWILLANYNDKTFLRNSLTFEQYREMGHYAPRTIHCDVIINGIYQGIYVFCEKIKRSEGRIDVSKLDSSENSGINLTGGYITQVDYPDNSLFESWILPNETYSAPGQTVYMNYIYPKPANITNQQKNYIQTYWASLENALYGPNFQDPVLGYRNFMSTNSWVDYLIMGEVTRNGDSYKKSRYWYKEKDGATNLAKMKAGPVWDFDWALKAYGDWDNLEEWSYGYVTGQDVNPPGYYLRLMEDPWFQNKVKCRYESYRMKMFDVNKIYNYIDSMELKLSESAAWHYFTWGHLTLDNTSPEWTPTSWPDAMDKLKNFYGVRLAWLDENWPGNTSNCDVSGVDELFENEIRVFPNPCENILFVEGLSEGPKNICIYDLNGKLVLNVITNEIQLNVSVLNPGSYIVSINSMSKSENRLIIKI